MHLLKKSRISLILLYKTSKFDFDDSFKFVKLKSLLPLELYGYQPFLCIPVKFIRFFYWYIRHKLPTCVQMIDSKEKPYSLF